jgi:hypothetical protein
MKSRIKNAAVGMPQRRRTRSEMSNAVSRMNVLETRENAYCRGAGVKVSGREVRE